MDPDQSAREHAPAGAVDADQAGAPERLDNEAESQARVLLEALQRERAELLRTALSVASSRSWRTSWRLNRIARRLTGRGVGTRPALDVLIEKLVNLELRHGPLEIAVPPERPRSIPASPPRTLDVVLWGATSDQELTASLAQLQDSRVRRILLVGQTSEEGRQGQEEGPAVIPVPSSDPPTTASGIDAALRLSEAPLVVLLQSGLRLPTDWLERLQAAASSSDVGLVATACDRGPLPTGRVERPVWLPPPAVRLLAGGEPGERLRVSVFDAGCVAITRRALAVVGGLDPLLDDLQHAATEFAARARDHGLACVLADDLLVQPADGPPDPGRPRRRGIRRVARAEARRLTPSYADRGYARAELRGLLRLQERVARVVADPIRFARELEATGRRPLSSVWVAMATPGSPRASALAAGGDAAALRQLGFDSRLAVPAHQTTRLPDVEADDALRFTDQAHLTALVRDRDVVIASHPAALPLLSELPQRPGQLVACVLRGLPEEPLDGRLEDLPLLAPSVWLCQRVAEEWGRPVDPYPLSADERFFHPIPDEPSSHTHLQVAIHLRAITAPQSLALVDLLRQALPAGTSLVSFGPSLATLDRHGAPAGEWRDRHLGSLEPTALAALLGRTDIMIELSPEPTGEIAAAAMACAAIPVVPHDSAAVEVVDHGRNGLIMRSGDPQRWRDAVVALAQDWPRLRRLQTGAVQSATRRAALQTAISLYLLFERAHHQLERQGARGRGLTRPPAVPTPASA